MCSRTNVINLYDKFAAWILFNGNGNAQLLILNDLMKIDGDRYDTRTLFIEFHSLSTS